ncbi:MAG: MarR family winged helix-turn-helix transcriptional regulator [Verrucomicrobiota bacterium]
MNQTATIPSSIATKPVGLRESFFFLSRAFYAYVVTLEKVLEEYDLQDVVRPGMGTVFYALWEGDDVTMTVLAERTELAPSSLTRTVRQMEKAGLVTRRKCQEDGRAVRIELTELGVSLKPKGDLVVSRLREVVEKDLTPKEIEAVKSGLAKMIENMNAHEFQ